MTDILLTLRSKIKMNIIITILLVVAGIIALLLIIALFMKREHYVKREIIINAPRQKVFDYLKLLKNQDQFNKWATADKIHLRAGPRHYLLERTHQAQVPTAPGEFGDEGAPPRHPVDEAISDEILERLPYCVAADADSLPNSASVGRCSPTPKRPSSIAERNSAESRR